MTKEAMTLALEALKHLQPNALNSFYTIGARDKAITALKEALAAPVQEPVDSAAKGAIMGAAYDFRDAHISGSKNIKRSAHVALENAVDDALKAFTPAAQPAPVDFAAIVDDIEAVDCRYRGDPSYDHDAYWMRKEVIAIVKLHASFYTNQQENKHD